MATDNTDPTQSQQPNNEPIGRFEPERQLKIMTRLWRRMAAIYGQRRWLDHAPMTQADEAGNVISQGVEEEWAAVLGDKSMTDIARGIERVQAAPPQYPPGAVEFRRMCAEFQPGTFAGASKPLPPLVRLLEDATVTGSARAYIDLCQRVNDGERLTRAELEALPACIGSNGQVYRPRDHCRASDDE